MKKVKDSKSMLIFVLLAITLIMVVGFAAFSTALQINGTEYCLTGWHDESSSETTPIYDANVLTLQTAFTEANDCTDNGNNYRCYNSGSGINANASIYGNVYSYDDSWSCGVDYFGVAACGNRI